MKIISLSIVTLVTLILFTIPGGYCTAPLKIPSFGQSVPLGTLLDARTATFLPGSSIFDRSYKIPADAIERRQTLISEFHFHPLNSTFNKFERRDYSRAMILSILSEQVDVEGSWRYLVEEPRGQSIRYRTVLKRKLRRLFHEKLQIDEMYAPNGAKFLTVPHTIAHNFSLTDLLARENENATHFVMGISYGRHIAAVFEDRSAKRRFGIARINTAEDIVESVPTEDMTDWTENFDTNLTHGQPLVRLYTDRPLTTEGNTMTDEEREQHFNMFNETDPEIVFPLVYDLMPLSTILMFLGANDTTRAELTRRWGLESYVGDPYIETFHMVPVYQEFDKIYIVQFKMREIMNMLTNPDFEAFIPDRLKHLENITALHAKFEISLDEFKRNISGILTAFRFGRILMHDTFEENLAEVLAVYQRDKYSPEKVGKKLYKEFRKVKPTFPLEFEAFVSSIEELYTNLEQLLLM